MTKTLSKEWGRYHVNVNCVAFGFIDTRLTQPLSGAPATIEVEGRTIAVGVQPAMLESLETQNDSARSDRDAGGGSRWRLSLLHARVELHLRPGDRGRRRPGVVIRVGDADLYYEVSGTGDTIVLLHGLGSSTRDWESQIAKLSTQYRVVSIDLRGHGRSSRTRGPYTMAGFAADIAAVLAHLGVDSAHICGISLGGMVAFQLGADFPERVRTLAIINSGPAFPGRTLKGRLALLSRFAVIRMKGLPALAPIIAGRLFPKPEQEPHRLTFIQRFAENDRTCVRADDARDREIRCERPSRPDSLSCPRARIGSRLHAGRREGGVRVSTRRCAPRRDS